jgi:hypothetical protein
LARDVREAFGKHYKVEISKESHQVSIRRINKEQKTDIEEVSNPEAKPPEVPDAKPAKVELTRE